MAIIGDLKAIKEVQKIKKGETGKLSISQITGLITNMYDARNNLTSDEFNQVFNLFNELRKCNTKMDMMLEDYYKTAKDIILKFDSIAPYEKYSGGNEIEFSFLMADIRNAQKEEENEIENKKKINEIANIIMTGLSTEDIEDAISQTYNFYSNQDIDLDKIDLLFADREKVLIDIVMAGLDEYDIEKLKNTLIDFYKKDTKPKKRVTIQEAYNDILKYGKRPDNPIILKSIKEINDYFDNLCIDNEKEEDIRAERVGKVSCDKYKDVDEYDIYNGENKKIDTLYVWANGEKNDVIIGEKMSDTPVKIEEFKKYYLNVPKGFKIKIRKNIKIDWGVGIPNYSSRDIMTKRELLDFAIYTLIQTILIPENYKIENPINNNLEYYPNIFCEKDDKKYAILVKVAVAPNYASIDEEDVKKMLNVQRRTGAIPMAAEIGFGSTDGERFSKGVALVGDGYYCRFTDFKYFTNHMSRCRKCHQLDNCNDDLFCQSCIKEMDEKMNNWRKK